MYVKTQLFFGKRNFESQEQASKWQEAIFRNFVRIRNLSLSKGSLGDGGKIGLRIRDRSIFTNIKVVGNDEVITDEIA
ncbi:MAG: hypothetical protein IJ544_09090 [Prevotella sp.]|nr:hypothetical protein [Prevotella sp.]